MRLILILLFLSQITFAQHGLKQGIIAGGEYTMPPPPIVPRDFYISEDGSGDGTTTSTPMSWASFSVEAIEAGDNILFKRGDVFIIPEYTISTNNILVDAWGADPDPPILYGSIDISGLTWTSEGSGIYSTTIANLDWVYIGQAAARCGETAWGQINAVASSTTMRRVGTSFFSGYTSFVGAKLITKEFDFRASNVQTVTAVNTGSGEITFTPGIPLGYADNGMALKMFNQLQLLTTNGDWYYDESISKLYVKAAATPAGTDIRAGTSDFGIYFSSASDCRIQNVEFRHYQKYALLANDCPRISITDCFFNNQRGNGFRLLGNSTVSVTVEGNLIEHCGLNGIEIGAIQLGSISENVVRYIGMQANIGHPFEADHHTGGTGITICGEPVGPTMRTPNYIIFNQNDLSFLGYQGFQWWGVGPQFTNNIIHDYSLKWNDCGAIHTVYRTFLGVNTSTTNGLIQNNIIYNCSPSTEGTSHPLYADGIYLDNGTGYFTVDNNTIFSVPDGAGIKGNYETRSTTVTNNKIVNCKYGVIFRQNTAFPVYPNNISNILTDNILAVFSPAQRSVTAETLQTTMGYIPFSSSGNADRNAFVNPYGVNVSSYINNGTGVTTDYTLADWRTKNGEDENSTSRTNYITYSNSTNAAQEVKIEFNTTNAAVNFNVPAGYTDHTGAAFSNPVSIPAYSSLLYFKDTAFP